MAEISGNPVVIIEGVGFWDSLYDEMKDALSAAVPKEKIFITPVSVIDWIGFPPSPERSTNRVMKSLDETLRRVAQAFPNEPVTLVAHSGGGTIAMIYLLGKSFQGDAYEPYPMIQKLITLGTPYHTLETYGKMKSDFIFEHLTPDFFQKIEVISITSDSWMGKQIGSVSEMASYYFYQNVSGRGDLPGDGIVTVESCTLDGARNVVIQGIEHLPTPNTPWYGASVGVKQWIEFL
ncbi:conserved hypothetical protein [Chloroherpeton thalassium ATCC 35110]|uniref:AB hydrolase-1 domain-containing protein n=1 Tax=Chloroherpeton thalassium (strain ATCC 35110 / GB-78) TaxID=517418 RepID=B3QVE9_CHLT3|nr:alpha/beta hydrolase [Chloroherpeton thalassium]ACF14549.1 conserved hypothetical protein [Chloroherpeton thalassium ATCC 35110]